MMDAVTQIAANMRIVTGRPIRWPRASFIVVMISGALLAACGDPPTPGEESLRQWVRQGQQAVDDEDRRALVDLISPAYMDGRGNHRDDIEKLLRFYFLRMKNVAVITKIEDLNVIGDTAAELVLSVAMAGTHDGTLGFSADAYRFEMELELDDDEWLLLGARWGELGEDLH
jgi:hypothetical protein